MILHNDETLNAEVPGFQEIRSASRCMYVMIYTIACWSLIISGFALYRALLRQKHELQLNEYQQRLFCTPIRAVFKRNSKLQSPPETSTALQLGYEVSLENCGAEPGCSNASILQTLEGLHDGARRQNVLNRILELASPPRKSALPENLPLSPRIETGREHKSPRRNANSFPGATRTLARPFLNLSGRRHVPVLINANRVPFLRLKKPQPPFLSRIIRDTINARENRLARADGLTSELPMAEDEDQWDYILYEHFGSHYRHTEETPWGDPEERPWGWELKQALEHNNNMQIEAIQKRIDISAKMHDIVEQETALAEEEKLRIRDEKHQARKARRLARRGFSELEIQEKPYPQIKRNTTRGGPPGTEEVPKVGQEEARQPNTEQQWRKRGDKYQTSEELKLLYEASLRPKTDEEIANIKEARARRKEEESVRKAESKKRKQDIVVFWEQKLNKEARTSTNERVGSEKYKDLDEKALSLKPFAPQVTKAIDYGSMRQPGLPPILEELREASGQASDAPWRADQTEPPNLGILRPSLCKKKTKNP